MNSEDEVYVIVMQQLHKDSLKLIYLTCVTRFTHTQTHLVHLCYLAHSVAKNINVISTFEK